MNAPSGRLPDPKSNFTKQTDICTDSGYRMTFRVAPRQAVDPKDWDEAVSSSPESFFWHYYRFADILRTWHGVRDLSFAVLTETSTAPLAVLPIQSRQTAGRLGADRSIHSLGGLVFTHGVSERARSQISQTVLSHLSYLAESSGASRVRIDPAPGLPGEPVPESIARLATRWLVPRIRFSQRIDLSRSIPHLLSDYSSGTKSDLKSAQREGLRIAEVCCQEGMDMYYALHVATCSRTGVSPHPRKYFEAIADEAAKHGFARMVLAFSGETPVAGNSVAWSKGRAFYWTAANSSAMPRGAQRLLMDDQIRHLSRLGIHTLDVGEVSLGDASGKMVGLSHYKRSFGGYTAPETYLEARGGGSWRPRSRAWIRSLPRPVPNWKGKWLAG